MKSLGRIVMALALVGAVGCGHEQQRQRKHRTECLVNLRNIGAALTTWREGHDGRWPESLSDLTGAGLLPPEPLRCPAAKEKGRSVDYFYLAPEAPDAGPRHLIACDFSGNHPTGRGCLFADGHVEHLSPGEFTNYAGRPENMSFAAALLEVEGQ